MVNSAITVYASISMKLTSTGSHRVHEVPPHHSRRLLRHLPLLLLGSSAPGALLDPLSCSHSSWGERVTIRLVGWVVPAGPSAFPGEPRRGMNALASAVPNQSCTQSFPQRMPVVVSLAGGQVETSTQF